MTTLHNYWSEQILNLANFLSLDPFFDQVSSFHPSDELENSESYRNNLGCEKKISSKTFFRNFTFSLFRTEVKISFRTNFRIFS